MPLLDTTGNNTADAYQGGSAVVSTYIEDVFSTYLYTGTGALQTINNGIDLSTKGGMVWCKARTSGSLGSSIDHCLVDSARGVASYLSSNSTNAQQTPSGTTNQPMASFNTNGFTLGGDQYAGISNYDSSYKYASWTFRKQPKFFDVVTYTGTGSARTIAHNLGSVPGCIIVKRTDTTADWQVYHNGLTSAAYSIQLNSTAAQASATTVWNSTAPTSTVFSVGTDATVNASGGTYVAYIYAHNAGGFGLTGTDNVISCGSYVEGASDVTVNLGYEPQWLLVKPSTLNDTWLIVDNMRGMSYTNTVGLKPQSSAAETNYGASFLQPTATGFIAKPGFYGSGNTIIYIAIRRGPMKVPTDATKVFSPITGNDNTALTTGFPVDMFIDNLRTGNSYNSQVASRLTGNTNSLQTSSTSAELTSLISNPAVWQSNTSFQPSIFYSANGINFAFQRAPSFFDEVCYTGTGAAQAVTHNLNAVPELMIVKTRSGTSQWAVYSSFTGNAQWMQLNLSDAAISASASFWNLTTPTSTNFSIGTAYSNVSATYVAYLFATCAGVSKVGSYTGTGATQTISCGFTGGARLVLIKRTDSTGNWEIFDTARGMVSGTDPHLELNTTNAETNANWVYTTTGGFQIVTSDANVNASGGTYIFLAIA